MARKKAARKKDDISLAYRIDAAPKGMTRADAYTAMIDAVREGSGVLPAGLDVTWKWRNSPMQAMREGDFSDVVLNSGRSRGGFLTLMERRLLRDAEKFAPGFKPESPETTKRKLAAKKGWETRRKHAEERARKAQDRSAAAKRGWETRQANARARSAAGKRGWETRRANARARAAKLARSKRRKR
jgi:hypothetical protein